MALSPYRFNRRAVALAKARVRKYVEPFKLLDAAMKLANAARRPGASARICDYGRDGQPQRLSGEFGAYAVDYEIHAYEGQLHIIVSDMHGRRVTGRVQQ